MAAHCNASCFRLAVLFSLAVFLKCFQGAYLLVKHQNKLAMVLLGSLEKNATREMSLVPSQCMLHKKRRYWLQSIKNCCQNICTASEPNWERITADIPFRFWLHLHVKGRKFQLIIKGTQSQGTDMYFFSPRKFWLPSLYFPLISAHFKPLFISSSICTA